MHTPKCWSNHLGPWIIEAAYFAAALAGIRSGMWKPQAYFGETEQSAPTPPYQTTSDGVAVIPIIGPLMKQESKFGGTSTVRIRQAIRVALQDPKVSSILLQIDSPGGTVAGTAELAADVKSADSMKPIHAHIEDQGASAAYWIASQARKVTANSTALVGSIGTILVLEDTSKAMEMNGIKTHVISTGAMKGAGADGAPITDEQLAYFQSLVNGINAPFLEAVGTGRGMDKKSVSAVADGRVWLAKEAKSLGLIDSIESMDSVVSAMGAKYAGRKPPRMARAENEIRLAGMR